MKITLLKPHTHERKALAKGDIINVAKETAELLVLLEVATTKEIKSNKGVQAL